MIAPWVVRELAEPESDLSEGVAGHFKHPVAQRSEQLRPGHSDCREYFIGIVSHAPFAAPLPGSTAILARRAGRASFLRADYSGVAGMVSRESLTDHRG